MAGASWETLNDLAGGLLDASILKSLDICVRLGNVAFAVVQS
jgi:hypothetical protein